MEPDGGSRLQKNRGKQTRSVVGSFSAKTPEVSLAQDFRQVAEAFWLLMGCVAYFAKCATMVWAQSGNKGNELANNDAEKLFQEKGKVCDVTEELVRFRVRSLASAPGISAGHAPFRNPQRMG